MSNYELTEDLKQKLETAKSLDEVVLIFDEAGIPIAREELEKIANYSHSDVLGEEDLDSVSGGGIGGFLQRHVVYIARLVTVIVKRYGKY